MPKKKIVKKNKVKVSKKQKIELSPINLVLQQLFSITLIVIGVFIWVHQYVDSNQGLVGLLIEKMTLEGFGVLGFLIFRVRVWCLGF